MHKMDMKMHKLRSFEKINVSRETGKILEICKLRSFDKTIVSREIVKHVSLYKVHKKIR